MYCLYFPNEFLPSSLFSVVTAPLYELSALTLSVTWRQHRVPCCRSVTVRRRSFLISAAYSKPSSFAVSEFFLETLIHVRRPSSVSSVVHLVTKPLILPVFVREWLQKYCSMGCRRSNFLHSFVLLWFPSLFVSLFSLSP